MADANSGGHLANNANNETSSLSTFFPSTEESCCFSSLAISLCRRALAELAAEEVATGGGIASVIEQPQPDCIIIIIIGGR